jgi:hypothetical protein
MLNRAHNAIYRPLVKAAWLAHCARRPELASSDKIAQEAWYREQLWESVGLYTTKELGVGGEAEATFDRLCLHFSIIAGDARQIDYWSRSDERRALHVLKSAMARARADWAYVEGIARQMGLTTDDRRIEDLPAGHILKLAAALGYHARRRQVAEAVPF